MLKGVGGGGVGGGRKKTTQPTCQQRRDSVPGWATAFSGWCRCAESRRRLAGAAAAAGAGTAGDTGVAG